ncbi:MAG TPA: hypothetical protein VFO65_10275, partial [Acidimicrobiales bacterium]|nr:hypothetical protein [Acidimicrobiales bacterium]
LEVFTPGAVAAEAVALGTGTGAASSFAALPVTEPGVHYVIARLIPIDESDDGAAAGSYRLSYSTSPLPQ